MQDTVRAIYRNGTFVPVVPCQLPEETEVDVVIHDKAQINPPTVTDAAERARIRRDVVANMKKNSIPGNAPRFTRDELHERA